ncbi:MAG TPA: hypothetical protein VK419_08490 [Bryobacteraceae bacterium]|nr:hypothetical protein [Bryobacteraceae bacterium]
MKYWGYLVAKLALAAGILFPLERAIAHAFPPAKPFAQGGPNPLLRDVPLTFAMLFFSLIVAGVLWAIVWDHRYRCRTCLRRLRMPIQTGSWTHVLLGAPRTEYICPYGHGTLRVDQLQITGLHEAEWQPHDDMWKELASLEETEK